MSRLLTTTELLADLKRRGAIANTQASGSADADLLAYLNQELLYEVVPEIMNTREEYFVVAEHVTMEAGTTKYRIPARAIGNKLRKVDWVDAATPTQRLSVSIVSADDIDGYPVSGGSSKPQAIYLEGPNMVIVPTNNTPEGFLEVSYYFRPGELALSTRWTTVTAVSGLVVSVAALPSDMTVGTKVDFHKGSGAAEPLSWSNAITATDTNELTVTNAIDGSLPGTSEVEIGDYVCFEEEAAAPMGVPVELAPVVVQAAVCRYIENSGSPEELKMHRETLVRLQERVAGLLNMRVEGAPQKITNKGGIWRRSKRRRG